MGISHEYHSAHGRARRSRAGTGLRLAGVIAAILLLSLAVTAILENGSTESEQPQTATSSGMAENILAPLPMQGAAADSTAGESGETAADSGSAGSTADSGAAAVTLENFGPARQTAGGYTVKAHDSSTIRQPSCGQVDLSYFADAAFLGDSLTVGFSDYNINLGGALICGYTGVGPDAIVNRSAVKSSTRGEEVALDVLAAAHPKKLYLLLGTNTLTTLGAADRFLAYYGQMLDLLRQTLGNDCVIYVQSIPPVRPAAAAEKTGLDDLLKLFLAGHVGLELPDAPAGLHGLNDVVHNKTSLFVSFMRHSAAVRWSFLYYTGNGAGLQIKRQTNTKTAPQAVGLAVPLIRFGRRGALTSACSWPSCAGRGSGSACGYAGSPG